MRGAFYSDEKCMEIYGCIVWSAMLVPKSARVKYCRQKGGAKARGIPWQFTLVQWWDVWKSSGKWDERGIGGYVMGRFGDVGPYSASNVYICTHAQNTHDWRKEHWHKLTHGSRAPKSQEIPMPRTQSQNH